MAKDLLGLPSALVLPEMPVPVARDCPNPKPPVEAKAPVMPPSNSEPSSDRGVVTGLPKILVVGIAGAPDDAWLTEPLRSC